MKKLFCIIFIIPLYISGMDADQNLHPTPFQLLQTIKPLSKDLLKQEENALLLAIKTAAKIPESDWSNFIKLTRILDIINPLNQTSTPLPKKNYNKFENHLIAACVSLDCNASNLKISPIEFLGKPTSQCILLRQKLKSTHLSSNTDFSEILNDITQVSLHTTIKNCLIYELNNDLFDSKSDRLKMLSYGLIQNALMILKRHEGLIKRLIYALLEKNKSLNNECTTLLKQYQFVTEKNRCCAIALCGKKEALGQLIVLEQYEKEATTQHPISFIEQTRHGVSEILQDLCYEKK